MKRQRGQTMIEFALMFPFMALFIFGMIYGGIMFMDYLNLSNDARAVARQIAVASDKASAITKYQTKTGEEVTGNSLSRFYNINMTAKFVKQNESGEDEEATDATSANDVVVTVTFKRDNTDLPWVVYKSGIPPEYFALKYRMKLENNS